MTRKMLICSAAVDHPEGVPVTAWVRSGLRFDRMATPILVAPGTRTRNGPHVDTPVPTPIPTPIGPAAQANRRACTFNTRPTARKFANVDDPP